MNSFAARRALLMLAGSTQSTYFPSERADRPLNQGYIHRGQKLITKTLDGLKVVQPHFNWLGSLEVEG